MAINFFTVKVPCQFQAPLTFVDKKKSKTKISIMQSFWKTTNQQIEFLCLLLTHLKHTKHQLQERSNNSIEKKSLELHN